MKNQPLPLLIILFFFSVHFAHGQALVDPSHLWAYYTDTGLIGSGPDSHPTGFTTVYSFGEVEEVGSLTYHRLRTADQFDTFAFWEETDILMREDSQGRVYLKNGEEPELLIYDFSLEIGDVFPEPIDGCSLTLTEKDFLTTNLGELRERFTFDDGTIWVRGIGSLSKMIPDCTFEWNGLVCFQTNLELEYTGELYFDTNGDCIFVPVHTEEVRVSRIQLSPNPARHVLSIRAEGTILNGDLIIYNAMGQRVHQETVKAVPQHEIDLSPHPAGLYYLELGKLKRTFTIVK